MRRPGRRRTRNQSHSWRQAAASLCGAGAGIGSASLTARNWKKFQDEGKRGRELNDAVSAAVSLTEEQKAGMDELAMASVELTDAIAAVLTNDQRDKAGLTKKKKKKQAN